MTDQRTLKKIINEQRTEIQQLKKDNANIHVLYEQAQAENNEFINQIETVKQILANWISLVNDHETCIKLLEVFGEKTP